MIVSSLKLKVITINDSFNRLFSYREIRSCVCIHTLPNICCIILRSLWPCWYAIVSFYAYLIMFFHVSGLILFTNFLFSASVGLSFLQFTNMNCMRNLIITGLSLFLGISIPQFFIEYWNPTHNGLVHTNAGWVSTHYTNLSVLERKIY